MTDGFLENGFIIDLNNAADTSEIVSELGEILGMNSARGKSICLKLGNTELSQAQLLSIKSLIESMQSQLAFIDTKCTETIDAANEVGINVSSLSNEIVVNVQEIEKTGDDESDKKPKETATGKQYETVEKTREDRIAERRKKSKQPELSEEEAKTQITEFPTLYLKQNLRSGQTMSYEGNIFLIGDTNPGSEIIAKGDITVWGVLGGIAHAGADGNKYATIRALKLNAIQIRISNCYARRPDMSNIPYVSRSNQFIPEEANIENGSIVIKKMNEN